MYFKYPIYLLLGLIIISCQRKDEVVKRDNEPDIHILQGEDLEMNTAIENAQKSLYKFKEAIESQNPDYYNFALKERFTTSDSGGEHIWISEVQYSDNKFYGIVDGDPISTTEVKLGDTIEINPQNITDWMYIDKNIVKGAYTTRVLRKRISQDEREKMDKENGFIFENE
ncbi:YegJ family protein [Chryseobacterium sp. T20]|uniref:YegJ family protein n=1 Tax=Chryseobacterium sp. T20 TaxID=3395375 RepID=UPI0039BC4A74